MRAFRVLDFRTRSVAGSPAVVEVPPLQPEDLGDAETGAPHDERGGARLVPVVGRQRVQQALDLVGGPVVGNVHAGILHLSGILRRTNSARKGRAVGNSPERRGRPQRREWQS